jgi:aryl-alcohol dehydrogenase-like predicted oxidoreductase
MNYRPFGSTGLTVSEVGFGAWAIGGNAVVGQTPIGWGPADDQTSIAAIHAALEAGISFFDTADFYGLGHSESLLGKTLKGKPDVVIATKVGQRKEDDRIVIDYSKDYLVQACEESLKRLQRETIDYYQLHAARIVHLEQGDCIEAMELLKKQGKIRYWGLSLNTFSPAPEAEFLIRHGLGDGFQLVFNLINLRAIELLEKAGDRYGIIARMPLQFGLLTGKFSSHSEFSSDDHRNFRLTPAIMEQASQFISRGLVPVAEQQGLTLTQLALSFILSFANISTVIPGIRTPQQAMQNSSGLLQLSPTVLRQLLELSEERGKPLLAAMEKLG